MVMMMAEAAGDDDDGGGDGMQEASAGERLRLAVARGELRVAERLLDLGISAGLDKNRRTLLHICAQNGHLDVARSLVARGYDTCAVDIHGYTPVHRASAQGHVEVIDFLLQSGCPVDARDESGNTALHAAAWNGRSQTVELLLRFNAHVDAMNKAGLTALHAAGQKGHNQSARVLAFAGCKVNMQTKSGDTPLHTATRFGHAGVAQILINARCKVDKQNKNGETALHLAVLNKRYKLAKILVEAGIKKKIKNKENDVAVEIARKMNDIDMMLIIASQEKDESKRRRRHKSEDRKTVERRQKLRAQSSLGQSIDGDDYEEEKGTRAQYDSRWNQCHSPHPAASRTHQPTSGIHFDPIIGSAGHVTTKHVTTIPDSTYENFYEPLRTTTRRSAGDAIGEGKAARPNRRSSGCVLETTYDRADTNAASGARVKGRREEPLLYPGSSAIDFRSRQDLIAQERSSASRDRFLSNAQAPLVAEAIARYRLDDDVELHHLKSNHNPSSASGRPSKSHSDDAIPVECHDSRHMSTVPNADASSDSSLSYDYTMSYVKKKSKKSSKVRTCESSLVSRRSNAKHLQSWYRNRPHTYHEDAEYLPQGEDAGCQEDEGFPVPKRLSSRDAAMENPINQPDEWKENANSQQLMFPPEMHLKDLASAARSSHSVTCHCPGQLMSLDSSSRPGSSLVDSAPCTTCDLRRNSNSHPLADAGSNPDSGYGSKILRNLSPPTFSRTRSREFRRRQESQSEAKYDGQETLDVAPLWSSQGAVGGTVDHLVDEDMSTTGTLPEPGGLWYTKTLQQSPRRPEVKYHMTDFEAQADVHAKASENRTSPGLSETDVALGVNNLTLDKYPADSTVGAVSQSKSRTPKQPQVVRRLSTDSFAIPGNRAENSRAARSHASNSFSNLPIDPSTTETETKDLYRSTAV